MQSPAEKTLVIIQRFVPPPFYEATKSLVECKCNSGWLFFCCAPNKFELCGNLNCLYVHFKTFILMMTVEDIIIFPLERQEERKREKDFPKAKFSFIMAVLLFIRPTPPSACRCCRLRWSFIWLTFICIKNPPGRKTKKKTLNEPSAGCEDEPCCRNIFLMMNRYSASISTETLNLRMAEKSKHLQPKDLSFIKKVLRLINQFSTRTSQIKKERRGGKVFDAWQFEKQIYQNWGWQVCGLIVKSWRRLSSESFFSEIVESFERI